MIQLRNSIKANFRTGSFPTESMFWDWIDSFLHKTEDSIEVAQIQGLIQALNSKADQQAFQQLWQLFTQLPDTYAGIDHTHAFNSLVDKPNNLAGYGIIDAYTKNEAGTVFAPLKHDHIVDDITDFTEGVEGIVNPLKNAPNGLAALDANGILSNDVLPPLSTTEIYTPVSEVEMLALSAQRGDFAIRIDTVPATVYILTGSDPGLLSNWVMVSTAGGVLTVNAKSGPNVQLTTTDIPEGSKKYFTEALARGSFSPGSGVNISPTGVINISETDPVFLGSPAASISTGRISSWDSKENGANKVTSIFAPNNTTYPTTQAVKNALDDQYNTIYEEGVFTLVGPGPDWIIDNSQFARFSRYTRVGSIVTLYIEVLITYTGSNPSPLINGFLLRLSGLPFVPKAYAAGVMEIQTSSTPYRWIGVAAVNSGYLDINISSFDLGGESIRASITYVKA